MSHRPVVWRNRANFQFDRFRRTASVIAASVADEVEAGQLAALPLDGVGLLKEMKLIVPTGVPAGALAARFAAHALRHSAD